MTAFETVYEACLSKLIDARFIEMPEEISKADLLNILKAAIFNFDYPRIELSISEIDESFVSDLGEDEIQVLSYLMSYEWLKRNILDVTWFTSDMTTSEFKTFSKSNRLSAMEKTALFFKAEVFQAKKIYHMKNGTKSGYSKMGIGGQI